MPTKKVTIEGLGEVSLYKSKRARGLKLSVGHEGNIRLSMPSWTSYRVGLKFIEGQAEWINKHRQKPTIIEDGSSVGKAHHIRFDYSKGSGLITTRIRGNQLFVLLPQTVKYNSPEAQKAAVNVAKKALKLESLALLPQKVDELANYYGFKYKSLDFKFLKGRWGSCNNLKEITLNYYLIQLPWELIEYVILHELTHTKILAHGKPFWEVMNDISPNVSKHRKQIRTYRPVAIAHPPI
jgi:predicted metal-dependent hydrolase